MASSPYFKYITSESAFRTRFQTENRKDFRELENVAASSWGRSHLFACRVVRRDPQRNILPILSQYTRHTDIQSAPDQIKLFLQGPDSSFINQSEHYLVRGSNYSISLAQIWAAMSTFKGSQDRRMENVLAQQGQDESEQDDDPESRYSKRVRRYTNQSDFVESSGIQAGSSSPLQEGYSSSARDSSLGYIDSDTHFLSVSPEDDTIRLTSCVIRHILYFAAPQNSAWNPKVVEFRDAKTRLTATTPEQRRRIVAIDDGGLCLRRKVPSRGFGLVDNYVAILEAKTQFQCLENGRPIISDECFAQMVCEALVASITKVSSHPDQR